MGARLLDNNKDENLRPHPSESMPPQTMNSYECPDNRILDQWQHFQSGFPPTGPLAGPPLPQRDSRPLSSWMTPTNFLSPGSSLPPSTSLSPSPILTSMKSNQDLIKLPSNRCSSPLLHPMPNSSRRHDIDTQSIEPPQPPLCAGCRLRIVDKFYLCAVEAKWHSSCLKCSDCGVELANQLSCFERDGNIYCKEDYIRIYANNRQCAHCMLEIKMTDLVMKACHSLFHVDCFRCATCDTQLKKGDLFGMFEDVLYCQIHFELITATVHNPMQHLPPPGAFPPQDGHGQHSPISEHSYMPLHRPDPGLGYPFLPSMGPGGHVEPPWFPGSPCPGEYGMSDVPFENNNEPFLKKRRGRKKRKVESFAVMNGYLDSGYPPGMEGQGGQGKTKRARTSFKHHQIRVMRSHFQINQNPDSRELKMLSQKTGLDKKVLQVWFQNARAKWRRMNAQGDSNPTMGSSSATGGAADTSSSDNGLSSIQDDPCESDPIGLGP